MNHDKQQDKPAQDNAAKLTAEIKKTWSKLSDADIALYTGKRDQFFAKVKELYQLSKEDAEKKMKEIEASCGCGSTNKAA